MKEIKDAVTHQPGSDEPQRPLESEHGEDEENRSSDGLTHKRRPRAAHYREQNVVMRNNDENCRV